MLLRGGAPGEAAGFARRFASFGRGGNPRGRAKGQGAMMRGTPLVAGGAAAGVAGAGGW